MSAQVVTSPFLTEHSDAEHRNELFAAQYAIQNVTSIVAALLGGIGAAAIVSLAGLDPSGPATYRVILLIMAGLLTVALATVVALDGRPAAGRDPGTTGHRWRAVRLPAGSAPVAGHVRDRGQGPTTVRPSRLSGLPHRHRRRPGHPLPEPVRAAEVRSGPDLAECRLRHHQPGHRGRDPCSAETRSPVRSDHLRRHRPGGEHSLPCRPRLLAVLWMVILAMAVRNALMNAGNPIFTAFAMEQVTPSERASLSAAMTSCCRSAGWWAGSGSSSSRGASGSRSGFTVDFVTIITLYTIATALYWIWFRSSDYVLSPRLAT